MGTSTDVRALLEGIFPRLRGTDWEVTSGADDLYNCVAWAAEENGRWWWPDAVSYWPPDVPSEPTIEAFRTAFSRIGYRPCDQEHDPRWKERVALFSKGGEVTHVARQLTSGSWTSKLGRCVDIAHGLAGLEGAEYGQVTAYVCRSRGGSAEEGHP